MTPRRLRDIQKELASLAPEEQRRLIRAALVEELGEEQGKLAELTFVPSGESSWLQEAFAAREEPPAAAAPGDQATALATLPTQPLEQAAVTGEGRIPAAQALQRLRCRADKRLLDELHARHHLEHFVELAKHSAPADSLVSRHSGAFRLSRSVCPRLFQVLDRVLGALGIELDCKVRCHPAQDLAPEVTCIDMGAQAPTVVIDLPSCAIETLDNDELAFVLGHEIGHAILIEDTLMCRFLSSASRRKGASMLPPTTQAAVDRWWKKLELSTDRIGLIACGNLKAASTCIVRAHTGLSPKSFHFDMPAMLDQLERSLDSHGAALASRSSHPMLEIRLKALELFSRSRLASEYGGYTSASNEVLDTDEMENAVDRLLLMTRRHPRGARDIAIMEVVTMGGILVFSADGCISDSETRIVIETLQRYFTDTPEVVLPESPEIVHSILDDALATMLETCGVAEKRFVVARLAEIALADGRLLSIESGVIVEIADRLGLAPREAHDIIVQVFQESEVSTDAGILSVAEVLKTRFERGFQK